MPAPSLEGSEWNLALLNGSSLKTGTNITLKFAEGQASGFAGCNAYGGAYSEPAAGKLSIGEMAVTAQACLEPEGVLGQEGAYIQALRQAASYQVEGERLHVQNAAGETTLVFEQYLALGMNADDLIGTRWELTSLDGTPPVEGSTISLGFRDDRHASGHAGCRDYAATYEASDDQVRFPSLAMTGDEACLADQALYEQEGRYTDALSWATHYRLSAETLEIRTARGEVLIYKPALANAFPEAEVTQPDELPTNTCTSPTYMVWSTRELPELSARFQAALDATGLRGAEGAAGAFGEDWYEAESDAGQSQAPCYFSVMETDFYVTLPAASLSDREALGASMGNVLAALKRFPPEKTPGPQPGFLDVTFVAGSEQKTLRIPVTEALEAGERGVSGAALMDVLYSPEMPGFGPSCEAFQTLVVTAGDVQQESVVTSYRCENATIDSTSQVPASPPTLALNEGELLGLRLGTEVAPDELALRLYPEAGIAASFFRWPEELPLDVEPVDQVDLEPALAFEYRPKVPAGAYSLVIRASWGEEVDVFYALSFEMR
jgi:heat shock protein HslJ